MIFDFIEWDEHNRDHATRRLTATEIEQVIWNADTVREHRKRPDRVLFSSRTDGDKKAVALRPPRRPERGEAGVASQHPTRRRGPAKPADRTPDRAPRPAPQ